MTLFNEEITILESLWMIIFEGDLNFVSATIERVSTKAMSFTKFESVLPMVLDNINKYIYIYFLNMLSLNPFHVDEEEQVKLQLIISI